MFRFVVLLAVLSVAAASPGYLNSPVGYGGAVVARVPTSYSSSTIARPVLQGAPLVAGYGAPSSYGAAPRQIVGGYGAPGVGAYGGQVLSSYAQTGVNSGYRSY